VKLTDLKQEIIAEDDNFVVIALNEARGTRFSVRPSRGGRVKSSFRKGVAAVKSNPGLAGLAAGLAVAGISAYNRNKRNTVRLFAKDYKEREMYKKIINDLMKTGQYKKTREKYAQGGYMWELKRK